MKRPLAYITAAWCGSDHENTKLAAQYCRAVYEAGFSPICPTLYQPFSSMTPFPRSIRAVSTWGATCSAALMCWWCAVIPSPRP